MQYVLSASVTTVQFRDFIKTESAMPEERALEVDGKGGRSGDLSVFTIYSFLAASSEQTFVFFTLLSSARRDSRR